MGRIMAFDYGTKRIGIAVTDSLQIIATGLCTIATPQAIPFLKNYIAQETVEQFVVGEPKQLDNSPSQSATYVAQFKALLSKHFPHIPIVNIDERFTSKIASAAIAQSGMGKIKRQSKALIDQTSAVILLQDYMAMLK